MIGAIASRFGAAVSTLDVSAFRIPTETPESDGTARWTSTTIVIAELTAGDQKGIGYTYGTRAAAEYIHDKLRDVVVGNDAMSIPKIFDNMARAVRNDGRPGVASMAISAVDAALWDLKARLLQVPLATLLGPARQSVAIYGSGGFTSYTVRQLVQQLNGWATHGITRVKMKVGSKPREDSERVAKVRHALGPDVALFVDANGAYNRKQALAEAEQFSAERVSWFEEPVSSDDLEGLRLLRDRAPPGMEIAAGEYGYTLPYFRRMLDAEAVDVLQADMTRCGGVSGIVGVAALCEARGMPLSAHTAPALHLHVCCAMRPLRHLEYFHDHVRIEDMLFDGVRRPIAGAIQPDWSRPGIGLELKRADAERFAI